MPKEKSNTELFLGVLRKHGLLPTEKKKKSGKKRKEKMGSGITNINQGRQLQKLEEEGY